MPFHKERDWVDGIYATDWVLCNATFDLDSVAIECDNMVLQCTVLSTRKNWETRDLKSHGLSQGLPVTFLERLLSRDSSSFKGAFV